MGRPRTCVAATVAVLSMLVSATSAAAAGCASIDYQATLVSATHALLATPPDVPAAQAEITTLLQADGSRGPALQPVLDDLATAPPDIEDAQTRLSSMSAALAYPAHSTCNVDGGAARSALHDVYASPAFRQLDDSTQPGLLDTLLKAIASIFSRAAGALGPTGGLLLSLTVLALLALVAWRRWHGSAAQHSPRLMEPAAGGDDPDAEWQAAERAALAGEHREAVRRAFRAALLDVALRGRVHIDAAWTTRELLGRVHADGDVLVALAAAAALFERAWYSGRAVTAADWQTASERCAGVRRMARQVGVAPG
ncbi:MAG: DUF4129 domain-containing protein [Candidatus Dormibacteraeota bacterium]|uniref:DUF4129 domain-containing protein n=1 Tax=Candidatus Amunia macphersoniae TaxID=3127014 RepID=A0A934NJG7_9BACT|nr:DUF4129 domain-containing protein [Candidatus Dormibacteraeota bacterium]